MSRKTMILFLSDLKGTPISEFEYGTDRGFTVTGTQTNEAPVRYAIERLKRGGQKLDRIIALVTPLARETAWEHFRTTVLETSPATEVQDVDIDNATTTELLRKTLAALQPLNTDDSVIIETTGGLRNAINALSLLARFLRHGNIHIDFSTYATFSYSGPKHVGDTRETDRLFELLDATNVFASYGNPYPLIEVLKDAGIPGWKPFTRTVKEFYDTIVFCKISRIDEAKASLAAAIHSVINADYEPQNSIALMFRDLIGGFVKTKLAFINESGSQAPLIRWCCDNGYLMQAVIILMENVLSTMEYDKESNRRTVRVPTVIGKKIGRHYHTINVYRNDFAHADGTRSNAAVDQIRQDVLETLDKIEADPFLKGLAGFRIN